MKQVYFHSDFSTVIVLVNGQPLAVHGEVFITLKQPTKMSNIDKAAWSQITQSNVRCISVEACPGGDQ